MKITTIGGDVIETSTTRIDGAPALALCVDDGVDACGVYLSPSDARALATTLLTAAAEMEHEG